jgi:ABC-type branched-subunit amino acid transport system substrate-binding protein
VGVGGTTGASPALSASDQGITPSAIRVGFLLLNIGGINGAGFALGLRSDMSQVIKAYVDWVNRHGGIDGRTLTYVTQPVDPLNSSNQQAACINMTEDQKVFAVLDSATTLGSQLLCYGAQHHEPYITATTSTVSAAYVRQSFPYVYSTGEDGTRQVINWADYEHDAGLFNNPHLGIVTDSCAPDPDIINGDLARNLARFGVHPTTVSLSCDTSTAQQQMPAAILQMRQAGVNLVFPATLFTNFQVFLEDAQAQNWYPKYSASDFWGFESNTETTNYPPAEWAGTQATTNYRAGESRLPNPPPPPPAVVECNQALQAEGVRPMAADPYGADSEALIQCDDIHLLVAAANKAGANPTRLNWGEAGQQLGNFPTALSAVSIFRPGKTEGGDTLGVVQWQSGCKCYVSVAPPTKPVYD